MRNRDDWVPTKFVRSSGRLQAARDTSQVAISAQLLVDRIANCYDQYLPVYATGKLADLGCGTVPLFDAYRNLVTDVVCVDWPSSLHVCPHIDIHCDLNAPLPFRNARFDTVVLSDVLEHVFRPHLLMSEISRILKPNGVVFVNTPFLFGVHEAPQDYFRYTEFALRELTNFCNLNVEVLTPLGGAPDVIADLVSKHLERIPLVGKMSARLTQWLAATIARLPLLRGFVKQGMPYLPSGYFMVVRKPA